MWSFVHKWHFVVAKKKPQTSVLFRGGISFHRLRGTYDGPSHRGNEYCGRMNQDSRSLWGKTTGMQICFSKKMKRTIQLSNKSKSQGLCWYGIVSVSLAKVSCNGNVNAESVATWGRAFVRHFRATHVAFKMMQRHSAHTYYKGLAEEEDGTGTGLA